MKYTPGPWKVATIAEGLLEGLVTVVDKEGLSTCHFGTGKEPELAANAYLIAAAPEMYEALEHIAEYWNGGNESAVDAIEHAIETAMEVLQKARRG